MASYDELAVKRQRQKDPSDPNTTTNTKTYKKFVAKWTKSLYVSSSTTKSDKKADLHHVDAATGEATPTTGELTKLAQVPPHQIPTPPITPPSSNESISSALTLAEHEEDAASIKTTAGSTSVPTEESSPSEVEHSSKTTYTATVGGKIIDTQKPTEEVQESKQHRQVPPNDVLTTKQQEEMMKKWKAEAYRYYTLYKHALSCWERDCRTMREINDRLQKQLSKGGSYSSSVKQQLLFLKNKVVGVEKEMQDRWRERLLQLEEESWRLKDRILKMSQQNREANRVVINDVPYTIVKQEEGTQTVEEMVQELQVQLSKTKEEVIVSKKQRDHVKEEFAKMERSLHKTIADLHTRIKELEIEIIVERDLKSFNQSDVQVLKSHEIQTPSAMKPSSTDNNAKEAMGQQGSLTRHYFKSMDRELASESSDQIELSRIRLMYTKLRLEYSILEKQLQQELQTRQALEEQINETQIAQKPAPPMTVSSMMQTDPLTSVKSKGTQCSNPLILQRTYSLGSRIRKLESQMDDAEKWTMKLKDDKNSLSDEVDEFSRNVERSLDRVQRLRRSTQENDFSHEHQDKGMQAVPAIPLRRSSMLPAWTTSTRYPLKTMSSTTYVVRQRSKRNVRFSQHRKPRVREASCQMGGNEHV